MCETTPRSTEPETGPNRGSRPAPRLVSLSSEGPPFKQSLSPQPARFLKRAMKRYGAPEVIVTDRLRSYGAAMKDIGVEDLQLCGQWRTNRA